MDFPIGGIFLYIYGDPCMVDCFMGKVGMVNSTISHGNPLIPTVGLSLVNTSWEAQNLRDMKPEFLNKQIHTFVGDRTHIFIEPGRCVYVHVSL